MYYNEQQFEEAYCGGYDILPAHRRRNRRRIKPLISIISLVQFVQFVPRSKGYYPDEVAVVPSWLILYNVVYLLLQHQKSPRKRV